MVMKKWSSRKKVPFQFDDPFLQSATPKDETERPHPREKKMSNKDRQLVRCVENRQEFTGAALVGKELRCGLQSVTRTFGDNCFTNRVMQAMMKVVRSGFGKRGQRPFEILDNGKWLEGLELNEGSRFEKAFGGVMYLQCNGERNEVCLTVPPRQGDSMVNCPKGATHWRMVLAVVALSDHTFDIVQQKYVPVDSILNGKNAIVQTEVLETERNLSKGLELVARLPQVDLVPATTGLVVLVGIEFLQEVTGVMYPLATKRAMKVVRIV
jgi:hypothetical protein